MSAEPDHRDDPWSDYLDCAACGAENALIEGWAEDEKAMLVSRACGAVADSGIVSGAE